jgi:hypothetical protein
MRTGRVIFKLCSRNYECKNCAYDQLLDEYDQLLDAEVLRAPSAVQINKVAGFMISEACYAAH